MGKEIPDDQTRTARVSEGQPRSRAREDGIHFVVVSADPEGETTVDDVVYPVNRTLERARGKERVMRRVKGDGPELFPVPHVRLLGENLV
jgi:hypothetical protein